MQAPVPQTRPDPIAGNLMHPTSNPKQNPIAYDSAITAPIGNAPKSSNLLDDHDLDNKMAGMSMQAPLTPKGPAPIKRTDTETSETDVFVDAEG